MKPDTQETGFSAKRDLCRRASVGSHRTDIIFTFDACWKELNRVLKERHYVVTVLEMVIVIATAEAGGGNRLFRCPTVPLVCDTVSFEIRETPPVDAEEVHLSADSKNFQVVLRGSVCFTTEERGGTEQSREYVLSCES